MRHVLFIRQACCVLGLLLGLGVVGCEQSGYPGQDTTYAPSVMADQEMSSKQAAEGGLAVRQERKIVRNYDLTLRVEHLDSAAVHVEAFAKTAEGLVTYSTESYFSLRIPTARVEPTLAQLKTLGKVEASSSSAEDVSDRYYDAEARIENLEALRQRYLALLEQATSVTDLLAVEQELARVNLELEQLKGMRQHIDRNVAYSTVGVRLVERTKLGPLGWVFNGLYQGIRWLFVRG